MKKKGKKESIFNGYGPVESLSFNFIVSNVGGIDHRHFNNAKTEINSLNFK
jgi:hypothetical protein